MENLMTNLAAVLLLALIAITFLQSGVDKVTDWKGNISWLKEHFGKTYIRRFVNIALIKILILEIITGFLSIAGIFKLIAENDRTFGLWAAVLACITLLALLYGQRIAKDYDGARTIVIYFIPAVICVYLLS